MQGQLRYDFLQIAIESSYIIPFQRCVRIILIPDIVGHRTSVYRINILEG